MNAWTNIDVSPHDSEIIKINELEARLGKMKPVENLEGCGSYNNNIQKFSHHKLLELSELFHSFYNNSDNKNQTQAWLTASLMKTLKEKVEVSKPLYF